MYLIAIGWLYVALLMAVVEAFGPQGSVLGALVTFVLYGAAPITVVMYIGGSGLRRRAARAREAREAAASPSPGPQPDGGGQAPAPAVAPVREEP